MAKKMSDFKPIAMPGVYSGEDFLKLLEEKLKEDAPEEMEMDEETKEKVKKLMAMGGFAVLGKEK
jgi:hypothetical protein